MSLLPWLSAEPGAMLELDWVVAEQCPGSFQALAMSQGLMLMLAVPPPYNHPKSKVPHASCDPNHCDSPRLSYFEKHRTCQNRFGYVSFNKSPSFMDAIVVRVRCHMRVSFNTTDSGHSCWFIGNTPMKNTRHIVRGDYPNYETSITDTNDQT